MILCKLDILFTNKMQEPIENFYDFRLALNVNLQSTKNVPTQVLYLLSFKFMNDLKYKRDENDKRVLFVNSIQMNANFLSFIDSYYLDIINIC